MAKGFSRRKMPDVILVDTLVWKCTNEGCAGWMRIEFSLSDEPGCPLCDAEMEKVTKPVPEIQEQAIL